MPKKLSETLGALLGGKRGFIVLAALAFAGCFLLSEFGRVKQLPWLMGWPPLLFVFTVPPEFRWRFTSGPWLREVFVGMSTVTCTGLAIAVAIETLINRAHPTASLVPPPVGPDVARLVLTVAIGGLLFGVLSLFSAWGLFSVFYRPEGPISRRRTKPRA